jgi:hypothetical protein
VNSVSPVMIKHSWRVKRKKQIVQSSIETEMDHYRRSWLHKKQLKDDSIVFYETTYRWFSASTILSRTESD